MRTLNFEILNWDSDFFGLQISRLSTHTQLSQDDVHRLSREFAGDLLYLFSDQEQPHAGTLMTLVDRKVTYKKSIVAPVVNKVDEHIGKVEKMSKKLLDLACLSGQHSRFRLDPLLGPKFQLMYKLWIERSVNRQIADEVFGFFASPDAEPSGFVTVKKTGESSMVGLIAVQEASQGKNIGKKLMEAIEIWALSAGCYEVQVATQQNNIQACRFYERNGYQVKDIQYIYHYHKNH